MSHVFFFLNLVICDIKTQTTVILGPQEYTVFDPEHTVGSTLNNTQPLVCCSSALALGFTR